MVKEELKVSDVSDENIISSADTKVENSMTNTEVTTNTNDVPQPFQAPLAQPASPDAPASDPPAQTSTTTPTQASTTTAPSSNERGV